jgi:hypothetical protein
VADEADTEADETPVSEADDVDWAADVAGEADTEADEVDWAAEVAGVALPDADEVD